MAEGYSTSSKALEGPSLEISDFRPKGYSGKKKKLTDRDKRNFYTLVNQAVLLCEIQLTVEQQQRPITHRLITRAGKRCCHAEQAFITDAKKIISKEKSKYTLEEISFILLISRSPCLKCRLDLEDFLTNFPRVKVNFTLRIGSLYQDGYTKDEAERNLAFWMWNLQMQGVRVYLEAINVAAELSDYRCTAKQRRSRKNRDNKIRKHVENIQTGTAVKQKLLRNLKSNEREYFSDKDGEEMVIGELTVSAHTRRQMVPTTAIQLSKKYGSCPGRQLISEARSKLPRCWVSIRKSLLLVSTHMPCTSCRQSIAKFLTEKKQGGSTNELILYIAHWHLSAADLFADWIKRLEDQSIKVYLQPLYVGTSQRDRTLNTNFELVKEQLETESLSDSTEGLETSDEDELSAANTSENEWSLPSSV